MIKLRDQITQDIRYEYKEGTTFVLVMDNGADLTNTHVLENFTEEETQMFIVTYFDEDLNELGGTSKIVGWEYLHKE